MSGPQVVLARTGERDALVIATMPAPDPYTSGERLVVGDARRISPDGSAELWRAWLFPAAGGSMHVTQNCDAIDAISPERLRARLQKRGQWWGGEGS